MLVDNQEYCNNLSLSLRSKTGMLDDSGPCLRSDRRFRCADRIQHPDFGAFVMGAVKNALVHTLPEQIRP
jgi:hypothetical protein